MTRRALLILAVAGLTVMCNADTPDGIEPAQQVSEMLDRAEAAIKAAQASGDLSEGQAVWAWAAFTEACLKSGQIERARGVIATLPERFQTAFRASLPGALVDLGDTDAGFREAEAIDDSLAWGVAAARCAENDPTRAWEFAERALGRHRDRAFEWVAKGLVRIGEVERAREALAEIVDAERLETARKWVLAGELAEAEDIVAAAERENVDLDDISGEFGKVLVARAAAGDVEIAERILAALSSDALDAPPYVQIGRAELDLGRPDDCLLSLSRAREALIPRMEDPYEHFFVAVTSLEIARIQIEAGDVEAAVETLGIASDQGQRADDALAGPIGADMGVFEAMRGKVVIVGMLAQAGHLDDAMKAAQDEAGQYMSGTLPVLILGCAAHGREDLVEKLLAEAGGEGEYQLYLAAARGAWECLQASDEQRP